MIWEVVGLELHGDRLVSVQACRLGCPPWPVLGADEATVQQTPVLPALEDW